MPFTSLFMNFSFFSYCIGNFHKSIEGFAYQNVIFELLILVKRWGLALGNVVLADYMSHVMRKPVYTLCEQQRPRSACASAPSDQHLCCSLLRWYSIFSFYIWNCKPLHSFCGCTGRFVSYLVANPEDKFSRDLAHIMSACLLFQ